MKTGRQEVQEFRSTVVQNKTGNTGVQKRTFKGGVRWYTGSIRTPLTRLEGEGLWMLD